MRAGTFRSASRASGHSSAAGGISSARIAIGRAPAA
jgi:hypothetical protein